VIKLVYSQVTIDTEQWGKKQYRQKSGTKIRPEKRGPARQHLEAY
jgi:hypothetical protein